MVGRQACSERVERLTSMGARTSPPVCTKFYMASVLANGALMICVGRVLGTLLNLVL